MTSSAIAQEKIVIVIPVYNEAERLKMTLEEWSALSSRYPIEAIVVVNDGSKDESGKILDLYASQNPKIKAIHQENAGHGRAVRNGHQVALQILSPSPNHWIFQVDSDGQFSPDDFDLLWQQRHNRYLISGIRANRHDPTHRLYISKVLRLWLTIIFGVRCHDPNIPYRLMRTDFLNEAWRWISPEVFAPNILLSIAAKKIGKGLDTIPVTHLARETGQVSIIKWRLLKACLVSAWQILLFRGRIKEWKRALWNIPHYSSSAQDQQVLAQVSNF